MRSARWCGQDYWVQSTLGGLQKVEQLSPLKLAPLPGRDALGAGQYLREVVPDGDEWKVAMANGRLYRHRDGVFLPWAEALWPMLASSQVYALLRLRDGRFVIGAGEHGPLLLDAEGRLLDRYTREDGVPARPTKGLLEDRMGGLWLAQEANLVRIDLARGISLYDEDRGLPMAYALTRWRGTVHVASGRGLYRLTTGGDGGGRFERVLPALRNTNALAAVDDDTLLVASGAIFAVTEDDAGVLHARTLVEAPRTSNLVASRFVPGRAWALLANSVVRIDRTGPDQFEATTLPDFSTPVQSVAEEDADTVWLADRAGGVWRVHVDGATPPLQLRPEDGVPEGTVRIYPRQGEGVWFTTNAGLRVFDQATSRLVAPPGLPAELLDRRLLQPVRGLRGQPVGARRRADRRRAARRRRLPLGPALAARGERQADRLRIRARGRRRVGAARGRRGAHRPGGPPGPAAAARPAAGRRRRHRRAPAASPRRTLDVAHHGAQPLAELRAAGGLSRRRQPLSQPPLQPSIATGPIGPPIPPAATPTCPTASPPSRWKRATPSAASARWRR